MLTLKYHIQLPCDTIAIKITFLCQLYGTKHSHWATPATVTHNHATCAAKGLLQYTGQLFIISSDRSIRGLIKPWRW